MPQYHNDTLVVTYEELVPRFYKNEEYLKVKVSLDGKRGFGIRKIQRGGGTEKQALIEFDSLPRKIREQLDDPRKGMHVLEAYYKVDKAASKFFQDHEFEDGSHIDDDIIDEYIANASVLNAVMQLKIDRIYERQTKNPKKSPYCNLWKTLSEDLNSFKPILEKKYGTLFSLPENYRRLQWKVEEYEKDGYKLLLSGHHFTENNRKVDAKTVRLLESIFTKLGYKPNYFEAYMKYTSFVEGKTEFVHNETGEVFNPSEFKLLSSATVRNYLAQWESRIATHSTRQGDRQKYMGQYKPSHKMDNKGFAGSIISVDDRQPPFEYANSKRVWFYLAQDPASGCFTTWVHGITKEGIIIDFYRQMVRNYAAWGLCLPAELECESALNSAFRNTLLREGNMFQYVRMEANNARGKYIEAGGNKKLRYGGEKEQTGWLARPFARLEANQQGTDTVPQLPYKDIVDISLKHIEEFNNMPHPDYENKTRWEVFLENQNPQLTPINWRGILPYIGHKTQTSCNVGVIRLQNETWLLAKNGEICAGENLTKLMSLIEGEKIDVYWLDGNDGKVLKAVAYIGSQYICEILPQPIYKRARIEQTEDDLTEREIMSKYVSTIEAFGRRRKQEIESISITQEMPKTLNNKFSILHFGNRIHNDFVIEKELVEVEVLPELEDELEFEYVLNPIETTFNKQFNRY